MNNFKEQSEIKNIIFDFGGVILNISHRKLEDAFKRLGLDGFDKLFSQTQQSEIFQQFETGKMSPEKFRTVLKDLTGLKISDGDFDDTWNQIIGDYPHHRIVLLKSIKKNYNLFLLSNTNQIHYDYYIENFRNEFGYEFHSLFHNTYWSFKMGKRKPDAAAYLEVIKNEKLVNKETLFIDDSFQNIVAASNLGIKTLHLKDGMEITDFFLDSVLVNF